MPGMCRFVGVAAQWGAALLDQVDQERQGVDLFGRDALVLGHVLSTLVRCSVCPASHDTAGDHTASHTRKETIGLALPVFVSLVSYQPANI